AAVGWPLARLFGEPGRLARENAMRSPERTAASAASLMVALALVVFVAVLAAGVKGSITDTLDARMRADVMVTGNGTEPLPVAAGDAIVRVPGVRSVAPFRSAEIRVDGAEASTTTESLNGMDPATLLDVYAPRWVEGSDAAVRALGGDRALVEEGFARAHDLRVGRPFVIEGTTGRRATVTPIAIYRDPLLLSGMILAPERFVDLTGTNDAFGYFVAAKPGAARAAVAGVAAAVARTAPGAKVESQAAYRASTEDRIDSFAQLLYALLAMSVVVALFGIVNSVFLAVFERTREFALLRAVGATQRQVRRIVRYESVVTAVIGAALGTVVGIALAVLATTALGDLGLRLAIPVAQLVGFVVLAAVVGVLGAALPARRAARTDVLDAMRAE
ncbi:ABC transporter permease, partial [Patulibacter sp. S7RM1-6]